MGICCVAGFARSSAVRPVHATVRQQQRPAGTHSTSLEQISIAKPAPEALRLLHVWQKYCFIVSQKSRIWLRQVFFILSTRVFFVMGFVCCWADSVTVLLTTGGLRLLMDLVKTLAHHFAGERQELQGAPQKPGNFTSCICTRILSCILLYQ